MPVLFLEDLTIVGIVGLLVGGPAQWAIGGSLAFIYWSGPPTNQPPNGVPFWWGHSAVLGKATGDLYAYQK
ncbi:MAG: hypothetical protein LH613_19170 [Chamaesiphon sp.]|nr:hypothetical protein [Chamaesiphon sp.]